jgi:predicted transglutaminase-like cysteine proteinase
MPMLVRASGIAAILVSLLCTTAEAGRFSMPVAGETTAPFGWSDFCRAATHKGECARRSHSRVVSLTQALFQQLKQVNTRVNEKVKVVSDVAHYGGSDVWAYPTDGKGDCEDFALEKRRELMRLGWPQSSLLMTVVHLRDGEVHAVLTAVTDQGDYVLDELSSAVLPWTQTRYIYVKRQSAADQNVWEKIGR